MPALEQHKPIEQVAAAPHSPSSLSDVRHSTYGPGATKPEPQQPTTSGFEGFNQFCIGFGNGPVLRHELGHMLNDQIGSLTGKVASDMTDFIKVFNADFKANNPKLGEAIKEIRKTCDSVNAQRHEVFADMFAHAIGPGSNNGYSQLL